MNALDVRAEIQNALGLRTAEALIDGVKSAVTRQIEALNPGATIKYTEYFNHSFIPDMHVTWGSTVRPVYLRYDLDSYTLADDAGELASEKPILMAVAANDNRRDRATREKLESETITLTTHVETVAALNEEPTTGPLDALLKESLLASGRGLLDEQDVDLVARASASQGAEAAQLIARVADQVLVPEAQVQIRRAVQIVDWAAGVAMTPEFQGHLSEAEIRNLLPYLLRLESARENAEFWRYVGNLLSFSDFLGLAPWIDGADVTPLVRWGSHSWMARHAQVSERVITDENAELRNWEVRGSALRGNGKNEHVTLALDGRRLKGRSIESAMPRWSTFSQRIADLPVNSVNLKGLNRNLSVSAPEHGTEGVVGDAVGVAAQFEEDFGVKDVTLAGNQGDDETYLLKFDLPASLAHASALIPFPHMVELSFKVLASASDSLDLPLLEAHESERANEEPRT